MTGGAESPFVDFGRSYFIGYGSDTADSPEQVEQNDVRLDDWDSGLTRITCRCAACKAETTFDATGPGDLFKRLNYDFLLAAAAASC